MTAEMSNFPDKCELDITCERAKRKSGPSSRRVAWDGVNLWVSRLRGGVEEHPEIRFLFAFEGEEQVADHEPEQT